MHYIRGKYPDMPAKTAAAEAAEKALAEKAAAKREEAGRALEDKAAADAALDAEAISRGEKKVMPAPFPSPSVGYDFVFADGGSSARRHVHTHEFGSRFGACESIDG